MKNNLIYTAVFLLIGFPLIALASVPLKANYPVLGPIENMTPNGEYRVYVQNDDGWIEVGSLSFDNFFRERTTNLDRYLMKSTVLKIRLVQSGGAAAHIDSVFLGGLPPIEVKDSNYKSSLKKLSKRDFDVIDSFGRSFEFVFPENIQNKILSLTARVESERISETPFQFPFINLYKKMDSEVAFYRYIIESRKADSRKPPEAFFKKFCETGSGHPFGFTYGWVWNDKENLYVDIDFTPDNTMDGGKDYAKVYVNTKRGLKAFKVSTGETRWGYPDFTYRTRLIISISFIISKYP